tara:strand:- start:21 stop:533 length:513 start_codon:yes stop_codon:yes gene_type:complete
MFYKEIQDYLNQGDFIKIKNHFSRENIAWFYNKEQTYNDGNEPADPSFFTHRIWYNNKIETSPFVYQLIEPIIKKIKPRKILRIKANLVINRRIQTACNFHVDDDTKHKVAIYYINTNNGFTLLDPIKRKEITCQENKLLVFDGKVKHSAVAQTDTDQRLVINFNYIERP